MPQQRYSRHRGAQKAHTAKTALLKALSPVLSRWNCARSDENSPNSRNPYGKGLNFSSRHFDDLIPAEAIPARAEPLHAIGSRYHLTQLARKLCLLIGADARTQDGNALHISNDTHGGFTLPCAAQIGATAHDARKAATTGHDPPVCFFPRSHAEARTAFCSRPTYSNEETHRGDHRGHRCPY